MAIFGFVRGSGEETAQALETPVWETACDVSHGRSAWMRRLGIPLILLDAGRGASVWAGARPELGRCAVHETEGTLANHPETKRRLKLEEIGRQARILASALGRGVGGLAGAADDAIDIRCGMRVDFRYGGGVSSIQQILTEVRDVPLVV